MISAVVICPFFMVEISQNTTTKVKYILGITQVVIPRVSSVEVQAYVYFDYLALGASSTFIYFILVESRPFDITVPSVHDILVAYVVVHVTHAQHSPNEDQTLPDFHEDIDLLHASTRQSPYSKVLVVVEVGKV
jgi:hypothetical protein